MNTQDNSEKASLDSTLKVFLKSIASYAFIFLPLGTAIGAIYEIGMLHSLGMNAPWRFFSLIPISPIDFLRNTLGVGMLYSLTFATLGIFVIAGTFFGQLAYRLKGNSIDGPSKSKISKFLEEVRQHIFKIRAKSNVSRSIVDLLALILLALVYWFFLWPFIELLLLAGFSNSAFPTFLIVSFTLTFFIVKAVVHLAEWYLGVMDKPQRMLTKNTVFLMGLILIFASLYELGKDEAIELLRLPAKDVEIATYHNLNLKCELGNSLRIIRSYTNGSTVLDKSRIVWIPTDEKSSCISININRPKIVSRLIKPTFLGSVINDGIKLEYETLEMPLNSK